MYEVGAGEAGGSILVCEIPGHIYGAKRRAHGSSMGNAFGICSGFALVAAIGVMSWVIALPGREVKE